MSADLPDLPDLPETLRRQLAFLGELDRLKTVLRQTRLTDLSRRENTAEHSWHLAMFALVLAEHGDGVDALHVVRLLLVHDVVEIDAGDVPIHDPGRDEAAIAALEAAAAERIFGLLPDGQGEELHALWREFEAGETREARFARALDRLQPVLMNLMGGGATWAENGVTEAQIRARIGPPVERGAPQLWQAASALIRAHFAGKRED